MFMALRILIVDDNENISNLLQDIISLEDHEATVSLTGTDAMNQLGNASFDLAFCDLTLPDISGWEVIEHIQQHSPETSIAVISGLGDAIPQDELDSHRIRLVVNKPFQVGDIQSVLHSVTGD